MASQRLYQRIYQVRLLLKSMFSGKKSSDDFDWQLYTQHYRGELKHVEERHTVVLHEGDYVFRKNSLEQVRQDILPLHPNHQLLYETILQLHPENVLEVGCGGGDHLANLSVLAPKLHLFGEDLAEKQLELLHNRHPKLTATVQQHDATSPALAQWPAVDLVYTQAVIMHIKTGDNHRTALRNLFRMSSKYVVLMENWRDHDFVEDLRRLVREPGWPWPSLHLYSRPFPGTSHPYILIASREVLSSYPELQTDAELRIA